MRVFASLLLASAIWEARADHYSIDNGCISAPAQSGEETTAACAREGLNCCTDGACNWTDRRVYMCRDSCHGLNACAITAPDGRALDSGIPKPEIVVLRDSCQGTNACLDVDGNVGMGSCKSPGSCEGAGTVGECVEECDEGATCPSSADLVYDALTGTCVEEIVRPAYAVEGDCIIGFMDGDQTADACHSEGLNCCTEDVDAPNPNNWKPCSWSETQVKICKNSCHGPGACSDIYSTTVNVGPNSCSGSRSCSTVRGSVGSQSCNGDRSCYYVKGVGRNSCTGENACTNAIGTIGSGSCHGDHSCFNIGEFDVGGGNAGDGSCTSPYSCEYTFNVGDCVQSCSLSETCVSDTGLKFDQASQICVERGMSGGAMDDPHFKTWSGKWYDFMGACDLHLVNAPFFAPGLPLNIDIRTTIRYSYSYIESAVIQIGKETFEVSSFGEYILNGISGAELPSTISGFPINDIEMNDKVHKFEIHVSKEEMILVKTFKDMVSVLVSNAHVDRFHGSLGMMGEFGTGLMLARDGATVLDNPSLLAAEWQVRDDEPMLFQSAGDGPQYPQTCVLPDPSVQLSRRLGESSVALEAAKKACASWSEETKEGCIYDVMATGDLDLAAAGAF